MKSSLRWRLSRYIILGISIAALLFVGWYFYRDWQIIKGTIQQARFGFFALSFLLLQVSLLLFAAGWHLLMHRLANADDFRQNVQLYYLANLGKNLPTPIWYIGGRAHLYGQAGHPRSPVIAGSLVELLLHGSTGLLMLGCVKLISAGFRFPNLWNALAFLPLIWFIWRPDSLSLLLGWWQRRKGNAGAVAALSRFDLLQLTLIYSFTWINSIPFIYFICRSWLELLPISVIMLWQIWLISSLVGYAATVLLGGIGFVREASLVALLGVVMPMSVAIVVAASSRLILMTGETLWGGIFALRNRHLLKPTEQDQ